MDACPPLEDIAAFLDGMLPPEERERITAHLAHCKRCYAVFAGAADFLEASFAEDIAAREDTAAAARPMRGAALFLEDDSSAEDITGRDVSPPLPFVAEKGQAPQRISPWLLLAAAVLLTAGVGFFAWKAFYSDAITVAGLAEMVENEPEVGSHLYDRALRGKQDPSELSDFMIGVYLVDLRLSLDEKVEPPINQLRGEMEGSLLTQDLIAAYFGDTESPTGPRLEQLENDIEERLGGELFFSFGLWSETGRIAARTRAPKFFEKRAHRRFMTRLRQELPGGLPEDIQEPILEQLQEIERIWNKGDFSPEDYTALAGHFESIILLIDRYKAPALEDEFGN